MAKIYLHEYLIVDCFHLVFWGYTGCWHKLVPFFI